tara:strand:- start:153 stop:347 length:195 start_codon:yes stop_codon:yes gene_type:complete
MTNPPELNIIHHPSYNFSEDKDPPKNTGNRNTLIDLSTLIFDIREKISDKEYKDIMETMSKLNK